MQKGASSGLLTRDPEDEGLEVHWGRNTCIIPATGAGRVCCEGAPLDGCIWQPFGGCQADRTQPAIDDAVSSLKVGLYKVSCQGRVSIGHSHLTRRDRKTVPNQAGK